ncbi:hypothetical protein [Paraflavitalea sp. CAU 1676]|uniref:hypothetical protein n=1 Tax=Paraflavitalea sp. CAU 1676 TaxID=3032598 RepID=UPI0023DB9D5D|nr:hypothetical protein [Paraflavitalea sp. CAU 1676]MDF2189914.1 hypothetical protein [Paraflavitalea sp. CAU 1676]
MTRFILILVAFSVLNQSIDLDYLTTSFNIGTAKAVQDYDDFDSITEYVIEHILDDNDYIPDDDDDSDGMPQNKGLEKSAFKPLVFQPAPKVSVPPSGTNTSASMAWMQLSPTCKGFFTILTPPPDRISA